MGKSYRQVMVATDDFEKLDTVKRAVAELFLHNENAIGLGSMIGILVDHWSEGPPDRMWLRARLEETPKRGRFKNPKSPMKLRTAKEIEKGWGETLEREHEDTD